GPWPETYRTLPTCTAGLYLATGLGGGGRVSCSSFRRASGVAAMRLLLGSSGLGCCGRQAHSKRPEAFAVKEPEKKFRAARDEARGRPPAGFPGLPPCSAYCFSPSAW